MTLLASAHYDPAGSVSQSTASAIAMTALDTTNLRLTFTVPANGAVLVRLRGTLHGSTVWPSILLGILQSSTVKARILPIGAPAGTALATTGCIVEALFVVPGLTPAASLTWDAAYGVEQTAASTGLKYGGPNNTTTNDAFGGFVFEIYSTPSLLGAVLYDPGTAASASCSSLLAMNPIDATNCTLSFTAPASGKVLVRVKTNVGGGTTYAQILLGAMDTVGGGSAVRGRQRPAGGLAGTSAVQNCPQEASFVVSGLTPGNSYNFDAAYGVEITGAATPIRWGGPNNTTAGDAWGALQYEIWAV